MSALEPQYMTILRKVLADHFVPFLPPLLGNANPTDQAAKQLSRAFSAFALHQDFRSQSLGYQGKQVRYHG